MREYNPYAFALILKYYMANGFSCRKASFLNNAGKPADVPVIIVNGRYDMICPPNTAYDWPAVSQVDARSSSPMPDIRPASQASRRN